nr:zinc finger protein zpr1 [Andalucia godoyi]
MLESVQNAALVLEWEKMADVKTGCAGAKVDDQLVDHLLFSVLEDTREVMTFQTNCPSCRSGSTPVQMLLTRIPHFKEALIMSYRCKECDYRSTEIKDIGAIPPRGKRFVLCVTGRVDMNRDFLKSDTAFVRIPEIDFELAPGTLGAFFTTLEGFLRKCLEQLRDLTPFAAGDSAAADRRSKLASFCEKLDLLCSFTTPFTIILDDPCANSYIQSVCPPDVDSRLLVEEYDRTFEQDEDLGLHGLEIENHGDRSTTSGN